MKYAPLIWSALWRKPTEAILSWLTVTAAFALFGLMVGVRYGPVWMRVTVLMFQPPSAALTKRFLLAHSRPAPKGSS